MIPSDFGYQPLPGGPGPSAPRQRPVRRARAPSVEAPDFLVVESEVRRAAKRRCVEADAPMLCVAVPRGLELPALATLGPTAPGEAAGPTPTDVPPRTMWQSVAACGRLMREPAYRNGLGVMLLCGVGDGLLDSAYLMVMDQLGSEQHSLPILAMKTVSALQAAASVGSMIVAHHQRDLEDVNVTPVSGVPQCYMRGLAWCGAVDFANTAAMAGSIVAFSRGWVQWPALVGALTVAKTVDACNDTRDYGFWNCLKVHLGDAAARQQQRDLNRTLIGVEVGLLSAIYFSQSIGVYALALRFADSNLLGVSTAVMVGGGILASVPKLYFWCTSRRVTRPDPVGAV